MEEKGEKRGCLKKEKKVFIKVGLLTKKEMNRRRNKESTEDKQDFPQKNSGREDLNLRPPDPQSGALTKLRYAPKK